MVLIKRNKPLHRQKPQQSPSGQTKLRVRAFIAGASNFAMSPMADVTTVRATITGVNDGYTVTVVLEKGGRSLTLAEKTVDSRVEAEAVARAFAAHHGVLWHTVEMLYR